MRFIIRKKNDKGAALIIVISLIMLASLFALSSAFISGKSKYLAAAFTQKAHTAYLAEGAAARIQWLIAHDRTQNPQRIFGSERLNPEVERYFADGRIRYLDYYGTKIQYRILDAASGIDISGALPSASLEKYISSYEGDKQERFKALINRIEDYIDANELIRTNSLEAKEYSALRLYPLPRNRPMEFKEELLWIPGALEFFPPDKDGRLSQIRIIPPKNMPRLSSQNNFFSADKNTILTAGGIDEYQTDQILKARNEWFENGTPMEESLETGLYTQLRSKFSFTESGVYLIEIDSTPNKDRAGKKLFIVTRIAHQFTNPGIQYYDWLSY